MDDDLQLARRAGSAGSAVGLRHFAALAGLYRELKWGGGDPRGLALGRGVNSAAMPAPIDSRMPTMPGWDWQAPLIE